MRRIQVPVVIAVALMALSACGSSGTSSKPAGKDAAPKVATLVSAAATPSASAPAQRPRERLDTTAEEFEAMLGPYNKCMQEHGGFVKGGSGGKPARPATSGEVDKTEAANKICEPQFMPLPPWEKDPANPESRDFARDVVKCLKAKGVKYVEVSDDGVSIALGGDQNDSRSISMGMDLIPGCERKIAAANK
jgi:hypothetical protein